MIPGRLLCLIWRKFLHAFMHPGIFKRFLHSVPLIRCGQGWDGGTERQTKNNIAPCNWINQLSTSEEKKKDLYIYSKKDLCALNTFYTVVIWCNTAQYIHFPIKSELVSWWLHKVMCSGTNVSLMAASEERPLYASHIFLLMKLD